MTTDASRRPATRIPHLKQLQLLRALDAAGAGPGRRQRKEPRYAYITTAASVRLTHPGGGEAHKHVCTRNVSARGLAFLYGGFLHRGTVVTATLPTLDGDSVRVTGRVVMCRHLQGCLHEVGVAFEEPVDPARFVDISKAGVAGDRDSMADPLGVDAICLYPQAIEARLLRVHLESSGARAAIVSSVGELADRLRREAFDVIILDLDRTEGADALSVLRAGSAATPLVGTASELPDLAVLHGRPCELVLKPVDAPALTAAIRCAIARSPAPAAETPIYSTLPPSPETDRHVEAFITHARATVAGIQAAQRAGDAKKVRMLCSSLRAVAPGYGFPQVGETVAEMTAALDAEGLGARWQAAADRLAAMAPRLRPAPAKPSDRAAEARITQLR